MRVRCRKPGCHAPMERLPKDQPHPSTLKCPACKQGHRVYAGGLVRKEDA